MIITITGRPCSGKSATVRYLAEKYDFEIITVSKIFRDEAEKRNMTVLEFNDFLFNNPEIKIDEKMDNASRQIGIERANDKLIFDGRLAWHFVPNSFKVFIDVSDDEMTRRLKDSHRSDEEKNIKAKNNDKNSLISRFNSENERYKHIYGVDNCNMNNYDFVIDSTGLSVPEVAEIIYEKYLEFIKK